MTQREARRRRWRPRLALTLAAAAWVFMPKSMEISDIGNTSDPKAHAENIRRMLRQVASHCGKDVGRVDDPRAEALFETTREVLEGVIKSFDHFLAGREKAWSGAEPGEGR